MANHIRKFNHQYYTSGSVTLPRGVGDRYFGQDLARDHRYLQGLAAKATLDLFGLESALVSGGAVTEGSTKARVNVAAAVGLCGFDVDVPNDGVAWAVPAAVTSAEIKVRVEVPAVTDLDLVTAGATLNGSAVNYLKARYREADVRSRSREFASGSYPYSIEDSYRLVCNTTAPNGHDVLLASLVGNGSTTLTITQAYPGIGSAARPGLMTRDSSGRSKVAAPSATDDIARKAEVDAEATARSSADTTHANLTSPHSATSAATASRLVVRDASGRAKVAAPSAEDDIALKSNVTAEATARSSADNTHAALTAAGTHGSTVAATANRLMHRDASGRSQVASPSADADVANKGWTRDFVYPVNSFYVQYPAASSNDDATEFPTAYRPATLFGGTWEEQWPTESVFFRTRGTLSDIGRANGMQEDAFQGHTFLSGTLSRPGGSGSGDTGMPNVIPVGGGVLGAITTDGINGPPRTAAETRTKNRHKKIWKRTA